MIFHFVSKFNDLKISLGYREASEVACYLVLFFATPFKFSIFVFLKSKSNLNLNLFLKMIIDFNN